MNRDKVHINTREVTLVIALYLLTMQINNFNMIAFINVFLTIKKRKRNLNKLHKFLEEVFSLLLIFGTRTSNIENGYG